MNCRQIDKKINHPVGNFRRQNVRVTFGKAILLNDYTNAGQSWVIRRWKEGGADRRAAGAGGEGGREGVRKGGADGRVRLQITS